MYIYIYIYMYVYYTFCKALIEITAALYTCIGAMILTTKHTTSNFKPWKEEVLASMKKNNRT